MTSEEAILKALSSPANGSIPYADEDGPSGVVNAPPRLGRSRIFAKEELMYAKNHHPDQLQQSQFTINPNPGYRAPLPKSSGTRSTISKSIQARPDNYQRRCKQISSRRITNKDADLETENPLQRYENALLRYRKPNQGGLGGLRREHQNFSNNGYSSSDSECAISRCNKSKSTSSIDTQSVNNILDEYEDLDYGRSSDLSDSGSISVTNFEAIMDQRKRQQLQQQKQQQQYNQVERSNETNNEEDGGKELQEKSQQHDQRVKVPGERHERVFKVNQQTQVRQRSRDRQTAIGDTGNKLNSSSDDPARSKQETNTATNSENRTGTDNRSKPVTEVLLRKGEVQKRVDEWLNQTQGQHFPAPNAKRDSGKIVPLVRSSSTAEPKNARRCRNDSRSRSTDENSGDRLNGTASYDDINRTEIARNDRKLDRIKNVAVTSARGTYKDYLAVRNRSRHGMDYGFGGQSTGRSAESGVVASRIPQRGQVSSNLSSRRRDNIDDNPEVTPIATSIAPVKQERHLSRSARMTAVETRISGISVKTKTESSNGATTVFANGRAASFKRARSHERNTGIATSRVASVPVKEDQQSSSSGYSRIRGGLQKQQLVSKGQLGTAEQEQKINATSPNKVGESRRLLVASRESRTHDNLIEAACTVSDLTTKQRVLTNEKELDNVRAQNLEIGFTKFVRDPNPEENEGGNDKTIEAVGWTDNSGNSSEQTSICCSEKPKLPRSRLVRENVVPRKPPAPPRRDHSRRDKTELTPQTDQTTEQACSSFRPASKRIYPAFRQMNEMNSFTATSGDSVEHSSEISTTKSHYASPKQVEKFYERSLEPEVIHADDLESILKPIVRASAYGEATESETIKNVENSLLVLDENDTNEAEDSCRLNDDNRKSQSPRNARYPEIGLDQCLKVQRRNPSVRSVNKEIPVEKRKLPTKCWDHDQEMNKEPVKTFGTFQTVNTRQCYLPLKEQSDKMESCKVNEDVDDAIVEVTEEPTYHEPDLIPQMHASISNSYEAQSTLRLDRNLTDVNSRDLDNRENSKGLICDGVESENSQILHSKTDSSAIEMAGSAKLSGNTMDTKISDAEDKKCRAVVNEVLVKNLRFQQDLPKQESPLRLVGTGMCPKPFNFNSVLSDDYEKIQAGDCHAKMADDCEIYVTKEEMERQRMMDLLKKRDYESVKLVSNFLFFFYESNLSAEATTKKGIYDFRT